MEDTIVLYAAAHHMDPLLLLSKFINKHHPAISVVIISTAAAATEPSVTYCRLPTPDHPQNSILDQIELLFEIPCLNNPNLRQALQEISQKSKIRAFIVDFFCNAGLEVSSSLSIPTYFCYTGNASSLSASILHLPTIHETIPQDIGELNDFIEIPGSPLIHSSDFPDDILFRAGNFYKHMLGTAINMRKSAGIIVNTFQALEFRAMEALANGLCIPSAPTPPVYALGPLIAEKSTKVGGEEHECLRWLDLQPSKSVIFLCFGRWGAFPAQQLKEIAHGLENSNCRFLWVVRGPSAAAAEPDLSTLLPEGFLERTKERGLVVKSWAPQMDVLSHGSVGGFVTHCGQSSILEAVSYGVPMIAWPLYAEQKMNRVFLVEEIKLALPLEAAANGTVTAAELERRVRELIMSKTGREVRRRVAEMKHSAEAAVRKGGSSLVALEKFMENILS